MCRVQVWFLAGVELWMELLWEHRVSAAASWQNPCSELSCCAPSKARSLQVENEGMSSHHIESHFSRIRFFFLLLHGNAGMINNQHISVAAFVLYSLNLLGCHLLILNLRRNKYRNRWWSNPGISEKVKLVCDWICAFCIILWVSCVKILPLSTREVFILSLNKLLILWSVTYHPCECIKAVQFCKYKVNNFYLQYFHHCQLCYFFITAILPYLK